MKISTRILSVAAALLLCAGCSDDDDPVVDSDTGGAALDAGADADGPVQVTVGFFRQDEAGEFGDPFMTLTFDVGVPCFQFDRQAPGDDFNEETHTHYNAATDTSYVDGVFTYTEYGPEHTSEEIIATCEAGEGGAVKAITWDDYFPDHHEMFLRIVDVQE